MKEIKLTQGKTTLVDDEDYDRLNQHKWHYHCGYASRSITINKKKTTWRMHWDIIGRPNDGFEIDHIDCNRLNNSKTNLRMATRQQNVANSGLRKTNTSGYKGVSWYKRYNKWLAQIYYNGHRVNLGYFNNKVDAAKAHDNAAIKLFKNFAKLNNV